MKRYIQSASRKKTSNLNFDFDLGENFNKQYIDEAVCNILDQFGAVCTSIDFHPVKYPRNRVYTQCSAEFTWKGDEFDTEGVDAEICDLIEDEGGNYFNAEFSSL